MAGPHRPGEFELIRRHFAPLARDCAGSLQLGDDAALLDPAPGQQLVVTADAMVAGVHFLADDPPASIACKLLRVNLSDLAAMGAEPLGYLLTAAWPAAADERWIAGFAAGLAADQRRFGACLLGGDTVATAGPLTLSLTALGQVPAGEALVRSGAAEGDYVYVSGSLGAAGAGLAGLRAGGAPSPDDALVRRYRLPEPRLRLGRELRGMATACIDVSDGLVADLGHLAVASGLAAEIELASLPMSPACRAASDPLAAATAGDDYELLFTLPAGRVEEVPDLARRGGVALSRIGRMLAGDGVSLRDRRGAAVPVARPGYQHF